MFYTLKGNERNELLEKLSPRLTEQYNRNAAKQFFIAHRPSLIEFLPDLIIDILNNKESDGADSYLQKGFQSVETAMLLGRDRPGSLSMHARGASWVGTELVEAWQTFIDKEFDLYWDDFYAEAQAYHYVGEAA